MSQRKFNIELEEKFNIHNKYDEMICDQTKYKVEKKLGEGANGIVYLIKFIENIKDLPNKEYVIKTIWSSKYIEYSCFKNISYKAINGVEQTFDNSLLCDQHSEYILGSILSNQNCINFIETISYSPCDKGIGMDRPFIFLLMEKADGDMTEIVQRKNINENNYNNLCIQVFVAIAVMEMQKINHNDLHSGNIFYVELNDDTSYKGNKIRDYDYVSYTFPSLGIEPIYIATDTLQYILKIGDCGLANKYSYPYILNSIIMNSTTYAADYYNTMFDLLLFLSDILYTEDVAYKKYFKDYPLFIQNCIAWMFNFPTTVEETKLWMIENKDKLSNLTKKDNLFDEENFNRCRFYTDLLRTTNEYHTAQRYNINVDLTKLNSAEYKHVSAVNLLKLIDKLGYKRAIPFKNAKILNIGEL